MPNIFTQQLKASSKTTILLLLAALAMLVSGCSSTHVHNFQVDASEAPEVYGIGRYQQPKTSTMRLYGSFKIDPREDVPVSGDYKAWSSWSLDSIVQDLNSHSSSGIYKMGGNEFTGGFEWFHKSNVALIGVGVSFNDGIYHHITYGFNTEHFEIGGFFGLFPLSFRQRISIDGHLPVVGREQPSCFLKDSLFQIKCIYEITLELFIDVKGVCFTLCVHSGADQEEVRVPFTADGEVSPVVSVAIIDGFRQSGQ